MATWITLPSTLKAPELKSEDPDVASADLFPVMAFAEMTPATREPPEARPDGTCTKMAGSMAAAARP